MFMFGEDLGLKVVGWAFVAVIVSLAAWFVKLIWFSILGIAP